MAKLTEPKKTAFKWIDDNAERLSDFHLLIWNYPESAFREYKAVKAFAEFHREEGFDVEAGVAGMPTAHVARISYPPREATTGTYPRQESTRRGET